MLPNAAAEILVSLPMLQGTDESSYTYDTPGVVPSEYAFVEIRLRAS
jgi:hypothetical protein